MAKLIVTIGATKKVLISKKLVTNYWSKRFNLSVFATNVVNLWLVYQGITRTAETQADFYNHFSEEMIDNTHNRFIIWSAEGKRRTIVDSDDEIFDDDKPLFGRINGDPRCGIALHGTLTNKKRNKRNGKETKYLLQVECKVLQKKTTHVCSDCADTDAVKN